jgi:hypothetical protein
MLSIFGRSDRYCDGVSRRGFFQIGAVGLGGLTLADMLRADARAGSPSTPKSIINIFLSGGPSHIDTFDPKPQAPKEVRGEFNAIDTNVAGIQICEHLPNLAARMDQLTLIRSLSGLRDEHAPNQTETGWNSNHLKSVGGAPSLGAVVSKFQGSSQSNVPLFVDLTGHTEHGYLGPVHGGFRPDGPGRANLSLNRVTVDRLGDRQRLLSGLDRLKRDIDSHGMMDAMDSFTSRAVGVITSGKMANALDLKLEDPRIRARYSQKERDRENDRFLMARRLVEVGVRCVSLSWGGWDTHNDNFKTLKQQLPRLDQGLSTLIDDLNARGMLENTIVLCWGEFGRTPRINSLAGRDHWSRVASVAIAGGGLKMGQAIGTSNRLGEVAKDRPVHFQEVFATLYYKLGLDPRQTTLIDPNGRPQYLVDHREPMKELI